VFRKMNPKRTPNLPRVSLENRVAERVWRMLVDAKVIAADIPPPAQHQTTGPET
jgi:hypothetical protein